MAEYSDEAIYCVKYLAERGYLNQEKLTEIAMLLDDFDVDFNMVRIEKDFFTRLAEALRPLWPAGEKDGKYPWRDSVANLSRRLYTLWNVRNLKEYTIEQCLTVARRYLAQYETNAKYMRTLKYFILKQGEIVDKAGLIRRTNESIFADMLEGDESTVTNTQEDWESLLMPMEGRLV